MGLIQRDGQRVAASAHLAPQHRATLIAPERPRQRFKDLCLELRSRDRPHYFQAKRNPPGFLRRERTGASIERKHVIEEMGFAYSSRATDPKQRASSAAEIAVEEFPGRGRGMG